MDASNRLETMTHITVNCPSSSPWSAAIVFNVYATAVDGAW